MSLCGKTKHRNDRNCRVRHTERLQQDGYPSKIKAAKTTFFSGGFSASRKFLGGFTATAVKIRFGD